MGTWIKYTNKFMEDLYSMLNVSANIRDSFIGPFQPLPEKVMKKLMLYSKKRDIFDVIHTIDEYTEHTIELNEFVSSKMSPALPFTYDKFVIFISWRPTENLEPVNEVAKSVQLAYHSIIKTDGIYEHTKNISSTLAKAFAEATQLKNATLETIQQLFDAIDDNNEKQYDVVKMTLKKQLTKLSEEIKVLIQRLRRLKIKEILSKLSAVHRRFFKTALEIFRDEFEAPMNENSEEENSADNDSLSDSLGREMPAALKRLQQTYKQYPTHSRFVFYLYLILFIILVLCFFTRFFQRNVQFLWKYFHQCRRSM